MRRGLVVLVLALGFAYAQSGSGLVGVLESLFVPQTPLTVRFDRVRANIAGRFPFSVVAGLQAPQIQEQTDLQALGGSWGLFTVSLGSLQPLAALMRTLLAWVVGISLLAWLITAITPKLRI